MIGVESIIGILLQARNPITKNNNIIEEITHG